MPITAHIWWLWGSKVIHGAQITLRMVRSPERWRTCISARVGSRNALSTAAGSDTARATTSRTNLCDASCFRAARQSETNWSRANMSLLLFYPNRDGLCKHSAVRGCGKMLRLGLSVAPELLVKGLQLITPPLLIIHPVCHPDRSAWRMFIAIENLWRGVGGSRGFFPDHAAAGSSFRELPSCQRTSRNA